MTTPRPLVTLTIEPRGYHNRLTIPLARVPTRRHVTQLVALLQKLQKATQQKAKNDLTLLLMLSPSHSLH